MTTDTIVPITDISRFSPGLANGGYLWYRDNDRPMKQANQRQHNDCEGKRRLIEGENDSSDRQTDRSEQEEDAQNRSTNLLSDQWRCKYQVFEVVEILYEALQFDLLLLCDRQQRAGTFRFDGRRIGFLHCHQVGFFGVGDREMKELPALSCRFVLQSVTRRIASRSVI